MSTLEIELDDIEAVDVGFTASELTVVLADGRKIVTPLSWYPRLERATDAERANFEVTPFGIHWPDIDEDLSVVAMLKGAPPKLRRQGAR